MARRQHYGISFPITVKSFENTFLDLDLNPAASVKSQIMHLIFTPVGQRLRKPLFGSKLIQFIFNPNDSQSWDDVVREIRDMISNNIPNCHINKINVYEVDDGRGLVASIKYTVSQNGVEYEDEIITNL
jgi:phage baseplate assembly protein W